MLISNVYIYLIIACLYIVKYCSIVLYIAALVRGLQMKTSNLADTSTFTFVS